MRTGRTLLVLTLLAAAAWTLRTLWLGGAFTRLEPHFEGECQRITGVAGAEDLTIHPRTGVAYVSSYDRAVAERGEPGRGALYAYVPGKGPASLRNLTPDAGADFHPHGIGLWVGGGDRDALFVVNHAGGRHSVEIYDLVVGRLVHRSSIVAPEFVSPNDVVPVGPEQFYVANDHAHPQGILRTLEEWFRLPLATVVFWDGSQASVAAEGIRMANGINAAPDGRTLYVAASLGREVRVYARDPDTGALDLEERVALDTAPDNVELDADRRLWIGAHPKLLRLVRYRSGRARTAPSQVLRLARDGEGGWQVEEVFLDAGERLSGSSVAAPHAGRLLIGPIQDAHFLDCRMP